MIGQVMTWFCVFAIGAVALAVMVYGFVQMLLKAQEDRNE